MTEKLACSFSGCREKELLPEFAWVPELKAIRQAEGRKPSPSHLAKHAFCRTHASLARETHGVKMYPYIKTLAELERRQAEEEAGRDFFSRYALKESIPESKKILGKIQTRAREESAPDA